MKYTSTRNRDLKIEASAAILQGISKDGGLFVPESLPTVSSEQLKELTVLSYPQRAKNILSLLLTDFTAEELDDCVNKAYTGTFEAERPAPLAELGEEGWLLELFHGPTCAFKDMALQLLPELLTRSALKNGCNQKVAILTATSGDTGKAALEGFADRDGVCIQVFYPTDGVSEMQKRQMITQTGKNVSVVGVRGNFDQCQSGVKAIFGDSDFGSELRDKGIVFSSANSINWGRLAPQIVYYFSAYCDLLGSNCIAPGEQINICVPTGNFGNILAAYYAKKMGLPVKKLICASNRNNILTDFIRTASYDRNRPFYTTTSPSMDILISSNLERLLYHLLDEDTEQVKELMEQLAHKGCYTISKQTHRRMTADFCGEFSSDEEASAVINDLFHRYSYLCDPHTAVAVAAARKYRQATEDGTKMLIVSTASPYKFPRSVLSALGTEKITDDDFENLDQLEQISRVPIPEPLKRLKTALPRFDAVCDPDVMRDAVRDFLAH